MLEKICSPALLYLAFSMVQIIIDLFQGEYETSLLKFIIMFIFTAILNILCLNGYTKLVWFIVIIPIILLTYISSVLFYVFGINPGKTNVRVQKQQQQQPAQQQQQQPAQQQQQQPAIPPSA
jgi:apolipoprotein N-acyltransferase